MSDIIASIRDTAIAAMPKATKVILFGSRARGDAKNDSDWDLLIVIDKEHIEENDRQQYTYPFWELGWQLNSMIHPILYTAKDWQARKGSPFYNNVESEGIQIC